MTPAMGQEPMKPITMRRRRFIGAKKKKTPNAERRTPNVELQTGRLPVSCAFEIGRWTFGVRRFPPLSFSVELFRDHRRIPGNDDVGRDAFRDDGAGGD